MRLRISRIVVALIMAGLVGTAIPALFPDTLRIAAPWLCPMGDAIVDPRSHRFCRNGETFISCPSPVGEPNSVPVSTAYAVCAAEAFLPLLFLAFVLPPRFFQRFTSRELTE
jgi:hypothetical protein